MERNLKSLLPLAPVALVGLTGCEPDVTNIYNYNYYTDDTAAAVDTTLADTGDTGEETAVDTADTGDTGDTGEPFYEEVDENTSAWPPSGTERGADMGSALGSGPEVSGIFLHPERDTFFMPLDNGYIVELARNGALENWWTLGGDLEGITGDRDGRVFVANESDNTINRFNLATEDFTDSCTLDDLPKNGGAGFEGLTFVAAGYQPEDWDQDDYGYFIAGTQADDTLYVYSATDCTGGAEITSLETLSVTNTDVAGLDWNYETQRLHVLYDYVRVLDRFKLNGDLQKSYTVPDAGSYSQLEGFTLFDVDCGDFYEDYADAYGSTMWAEDAQGDSSSGGLYWFTGDTAMPVACQPNPDGTLLTSSEE